MNRSAHGRVEAVAFFRAAIKLHRSLLRGIHRKDSGRFFHPPARCFDAVVAVVVVVARDHHANDKEFHQIER